MVGAGVTVEDLFEGDGFILEMVNEDLAAADRESVG
jgi:hypothetical protein